MRGDLSNEIVSVKIEEGSKRPIALHEKSKFGKIEADCLNLSLIEACYLMEKGRLNIYEDDIECSIGYLIDAILLETPVLDRKAEMVIPVRGGRERIERTALRKEGAERMLAHLHDV